MSNDKEINESEHSETEHSESETEETREREEEETRERERKHSTSVARKYFKHGKIAEWLNDERYNKNNKRKAIWSCHDDSFIQFSDFVDNERLDPNDYMRSGWSTQMVKMLDCELFDKSKFTEGPYILLSSNTEIKDQDNQDNQDNQENKEQEPSFIDPILEMIHNEDFSRPMDGSFLDQILEMQKFHLQSLIRLKWMEKCLLSFGV